MLNAHFIAHHYTARARTNVYRCVLPFLDKQRLTFVLYREICCPQKKAYETSKPRY